MPEFMRLVLKTVGEQQVGQHGLAVLAIKTVERVTRTLQQAPDHVDKLGRPRFALRIRLAKGLHEAALAAPITPARHIKHRWQQSTHFELRGGERQSRTSS
jgi:hypothetical protein